MQERKSDQNIDFEGSGLPDDQSSCVKMPFFIKTNHIWTELLQKTTSQHVLWPLLKQKW
jgi:hypothetical protein